MSYDINRPVDWLNDLILLKWHGFISFLLAIFVFVSLISIFNQRQQKCKSRFPTLFDIWFCCPWRSSSNFATLSLHTSPLLAAFHFYFFTLKYNEDIYLLSKRILSILLVCYILEWEGVSSLSTWHYDKGQSSPVNYVS